MNWTLLDQILKQSEQILFVLFSKQPKLARKFKKKTQWTFKFESSAFAFVCFENSSLLKLEISSFRRFENFKLQKGWNQTQNQMIQTFLSDLADSF